ncbi:hypothetical protein AMTRI_Chr04g184980 [Amborella trichopoda]
MSLYKQKSSLELLEEIDLLYYDLTLMELEDIVWDELSESGDHIVPQPGGEQEPASLLQGDSHRKFCEAVNVVERVVDSKTSGSHNDSNGKEEYDMHSKGGQPTPLLETGSWSNMDADEFAAAYYSECADKAGVASRESKISDNGCENNNAERAGSDVMSDFCVDGPMLGNRDSATESNLCDFLFIDLSPPESDLEIFGNEHDDKNNSNLMDYGWPSIGNFEDIDRMFRTCDSTYGQGSSGNGDELLWAPSSPCPIDCPGEVSKSGLGSPSGSSALKRKSEQYEAGMEFMPCENPPCDSDKKANSCILQTSDWNSGADGSLNSFGINVSHQDGDAQSKETSMSKDQTSKIRGELHESNGRKEEKVESQSQVHKEKGCLRNTDMANMQKKQSKNRKQLDGKSKDQTLEHPSSNPLNVNGSVQQFMSLRPATSAPSAMQVFPSPLLSQQKQYWGPDSFRYLQTNIPYMHVGYGYPPNQIPVMPTMPNIKSHNQGQPVVAGYKFSIDSNNSQTVKRTMESAARPLFMTPQEKIEKLRRRQQIRATLAVDNQSQQQLCQSSCDRPSVQKQSQETQSSEEIEVKREVEDKSTDFSAVEMDSTTHDRSCMSSMSSDEISLEETSFRQLQDVMSQLDLKTKLCIRDGLYRLARSAVQRHHINDTSSSSKKGLPFSEEFSTHDELKFSRSAGLIDMETETNPIDRSIAFLLFHRASDPFKRSNSDTLPLESHILVNLSKLSLPPNPELNPIQATPPSPIDMELKEQKLHCNTTQPLTSDQQVCLKDPIKTKEEHDQMH